MTLYLIAPQRQPPAALTGSFSGMVYVVQETRVWEEVCFLQMQKQKKKSVGGGCAARRIDIHRQPRAQMLVMHLAGVALCCTSWCGEIMLRITVSRELAVYRVSIHYNYSNRTPT